MNPPPAEPHTLFPACLGWHTSLHTCAMTSPVAGLICRRTGPDANHSRPSHTPGSDAESPNSCRNANLFLLVVAAAAAAVDMLLLLLKRRRVGLGVLFFGGVGVSTEVCGLKRERRSSGRRGRRSIWSGVASCCCACVRIDRDAGVSYTQRQATERTSSLTRCVFFLLLLAYPASWRAVGNGSERTDVRCLVCLGLALAAAPL